MDAIDPLENNSSNMSMKELLFDNRRLRLIPTNPDMKQVAADLIEEYKLEEAFFVCDLEDVINKHAEWIAHMPRVRPFYAVKCNDSPLVLETLAGLGAGFDCASKEEMRKVMDVGVLPTDIIYANPAKPRSHIVAAAGLGVRTVTFDSESELFKIKKYLPGARLVVRIRCDAEKAVCPLGMKFGASVPEAKQLLDVAKTLNMNVIGVSFHVGSGCMEPLAFLRAIASARLLFDYAAQEFGYEFSILDIGGGFPGNSGTSVSEIASIVNNALELFFPEDCGVEIIAEPGRYYVASAFTLITQIHSKRVLQNDDATHHYMYYINDGVYGSFNCLMYDHAVVHPELLDNRRSDDTDLCESSIWGPTCDGLDQVCTNEQLPKMEIGEWLIFRDMGAYTLVAGGTFNGFPMPKVHTVASPNAWKILQEFIKSTAYVVDDVPVFNKAGLGYNRDAVGWGCVELAVGGDVASLSSTDDTEDGHLNNNASSIPSDDDSAFQETDEGQSSNDEIII